MSGLISYVLPVYNCQSTLANCLNGLLKQEIKGEIIVIDDGSTDNTPIVLRHFKDKIDKIITNKTRKGGAYSRNRGNKVAKGDIIAVCDVDQYYKSRSTHIDAFFKENEDKDVFYSALHLKDHNDMLNKYTMDAYEWDFKSKCPISHPTVAYRKKILETVKYKELSIETDLYEFFLLDAHLEGFEFGGSQNPLMLKVEGNSIRKVGKAKDLKKDLYKKYGIDV